MNQEALQIILSLSVHVIEIFALIFLFYTNSFLIKRRKREIGVYHILGMGKPQLAKMLVIVRSVFWVESFSELRLQS